MLKLKGLYVCVCVCVIKSTNIYSTSFIVGDLIFVQLQGDLLLLFFFR